MQHPRKKFLFIISALAILALALAFIQPGAVSAGPAPQGDDGERGYNPDTGQLIFVGALPGEAIPSPAEEVSALSVEENGLALIGLYAAELGLSDPPNELQSFQAKPALEGGSVVRYRQVYQGVPVFGADTVINMDETGGLTALSAKVVPNLSLEVNPAITAEEAVQAALQAVAKAYQVDAAVLTASPPELWIFDESLFMPSRWPARLVWRMEVGAGDLPLREAVLVDAQKGMIALHYSQIEDAEAINVYDLDGSETLPGTLMCSYPNPAGCNGINDALKAYNLTDDAWTYYQSFLGRDSIDNAGMTIKTSVRYGTVAKAMWDGTQMYFGPGYLADDVLGHEYTHGVTQYESGLIYYAQPGAINESLSDVFGEFIDQYNGDTDPLKKWLHGEDLSGGAIRSLKTPASPPAPACTYPSCSAGQHARQPDSMLSAYYYTGLDDSAGVHFNSGVNNKADYLMSDGGSFNGKTVTALGSGKVEQIYYKAQTDLLGSGSSYMDLYYILYQSCVDLVGTNGIVMDDCREVRDATDAVKMNQTKSASVYPVADFCTTGQVLGQTLFNDDFESGWGQWGLGSNWSPETTDPAGGTTSLYWGYPSTNTAYSAYMISNVSIPSGKKVFMRFEHDFGFDWQSPAYYYDGGVVEYSLDGGITWTDAALKFSAGQNYNGTVLSYWGGGNPLAGQKAFVKETMNYTQSRYDLSTFGGKDIKFRFRAGTDSSTSADGWWIDNVRIYTCIGVPGIPALQTPAANGLVTDYTPTLNWSDAAPDLDHYQIQVDDNSDFSTTLYDDDTLAISQYDVPGSLDPNKTFYWRVRAFNMNDDTKGWTAGRAFRTALLPPDLLSPTHFTNLPNKRPTFDWTDVSGSPAPTGYTVQVSRNEAFTLVVNTGNVTASTYTPTVDLPADTILWWRVQTKGANGPSAWTSAWKFHTANPPSVPTLLTPASNALLTDYTPRLDWNIVTVPADTFFGYYELEVDDDPNFLSAYGAASLGVGNHEHTIPTPNALNPDTKYYWRVRARRDNHEYSAWSLVRYFRTALPPPDLQVPNNLASPPVNRPTFDWGTVTNATGYSLQVSKNEAFTLLALNASITGGTNSTYTPTVDLPADIVLWWRVQTKGANGPSAWTIAWKFYTPNPPSIPTLVSPANNALLTDYTPLLDWNIVTVPAGAPGFRGYCVQVDDTADFSSAKFTVCVAATINDHQYEVEPTYILDANTTYYWRAQSYNTDYEYSSWSLARNFRTALAPPVLSLPANGSNLPTTKPTFVWSAVSGASGYTIQVSKNSAFTLLAKSASVTGGTNSTYTPTTALPVGMTLYWHVKANGTPNGPSAWSNDWTFCIAPGCE
jgi:Zn-dependent metalloprotease